MASTETIRRPTVRIQPAARKALLTLHVVTAVSLVGIALVLAILGAAGLGGAAPETVYPAMHQMARAALAPVAVVAVVVGVVQALLTGYGLLRHWWVTAKLVVTSLLAAVAVLVVVPGLGRASAAATSHVEAVNDAQRLVSVVTPSVALALLVLMAALGVVKPGRRRRAGGR